MGGGRIALNITAESEDPEERRQTHWPNGESEQGKGTTPATHPPNGTIPHQTSACRVSLGGKTPKHAHIHRAKQSQRLHQMESTHLERARRSKQQELKTPLGQRGQTAPSPGDTSSQQIYISTITINICKKTQDSQPAIDGLKTSCETA